MPSKMKKKPILPRDAKAVSKPDRAPLHRVVISMDDSSVKDPVVWKEAVERLKQGGLDVSREMNVIGMVAGTVPEPKRAALAAMPHVMGVEDDERRSTR